MNEERKILIREMLLWFYISLAAIFGICVLLFAGYFIWSDFTTSPKIPRMRLWLLPVELLFVLLAALGPLAWVSFMARMAFKSINDEKEVLESQGVIGLNRFREGNPVYRRPFSFRSPK